MGNQLLDYQYRYKWDYTREEYFPAIRMLGILVERRRRPRPQESLWRCRAGIDLPQGLPRGGCDALRWCGYVLAGLWVGGILPAIGTARISRKPAGISRSTECDKRFIRLLRRRTGVQGGNRPSRLDNPQAWPWSRPVLPRSVEADVTEWELKLLNKQVRDWEISNGVKMLCPYSYRARTTRPCSIRTGISVNSSLTP